MTYRRRLIDDVLDEVFPQLPAILLDGPKAVGKTTTALQRARTVKDLDQAGDRTLALADPDSVVLGDKPILIDEWHRVPDTWGVIKRSVDRDYSGGQYLLTGSLPDSATHSGAGRITSLRMRPLSFAEREIERPSVSLRDLLHGNADIQGETSVTLTDYHTEMMRSGFPAFRQLDGQALQRALNGYIERIVDADVKTVGLELRQPATLRAWLASYAAATATVASWETIRDTAATGTGKIPAKSTVLSYRDSLTRLRILDDLPPWLPSRNSFSRVAQSSKHFLADPALAMRLMNFSPSTIGTAVSYGSGRYDHPLAGRMFEALVTLSVRSYADVCQAQVMHFRDGQGRREIDIIVERNDGKVLAIEVKMGTTVDAHDIRHLTWLRQQLGDDLIDSVVVYSGRHAYRMNGVAVIPLALLGP
jgi:uncharacterized protein